MHELISQSVAIIEANQSPGGAYMACPTYPTYHYCWFRDGTFTAHAMDLWGHYESAQQFYEWATQVVLEQSGAVERCIAAVERGENPNPADLLHARYSVDGHPGEEEWPNFQLDGFGTLLWGFRRHQVLAGLSTFPPTWAEAIRLLVRYVAALWQYPNSDCWEEYSERIAVSTLAALHAGLSAAANMPHEHSAERARASTAAMQIKQKVLEAGVQEGHLIKQLNGEDVVDASLLWASVPFGTCGLLRPDDPLMRATVTRIEADLIGATGGVHRYRADTFYGGGEWILLTALLGEYRAASGDTNGALESLAYAETHTAANYYLPEQIIVAPLNPSYVAPWTKRWGPVACPLLWSHAAYLSLFATLKRGDSPFPS
jgi:GH15 family glucan-1,4-alpha-glucosidase